MEILSNVSSEHWYGSPSPKRHRTKEDFFTFCNIVLAYTQYESYKQEELRAAHNTSPLDSGGSTADSYTSESTSSSFSMLGGQDPDRLVAMDDEDQDLITCFCMKPYAGRPMIECSECNTWIHLSCAKIRKSNIPDDFVCQQCKDSKMTKRKSKRARSEKKYLSE
ncbi:PHD finger protein 13 isoform X2 [Lingula anatina]|uniref:PHD finger protein 13 isoform X2 n=1 Tax=Lingula anatina TaxID=7574 RepID=A0A1S3H568_LINAN|nr:PHD finger protein 13 isoform X2 [Lingula anatina]|eukprot:XP_013380606.1 PHD finger protein 13 isoform X2 [Lingula anatina]